MDSNDTDYNPVVEGLSEFAKDALTYSAQEPSKLRDSWWLRWLKFATIIIFPAVVFGTGLLFADYFMEYNGETCVQRSFAESRVRHDSVKAMRFRFVLGAALGGGLGAIYVGRCIARRVDP
jgi:hypothetical protein